MKLRIRTPGISILPFLCLIVVPWLPACKGQHIRATSPDERIEFQLFMAEPPQDGSDSDDAPQLAYTVSFQGRPLLDTSFLGLRFQGQPLLGRNLELVSTSTNAIDVTYTIPVGKSKEIRNQYNSVLAEYQESGFPGRKLNIEVRVYNDGVAFRYMLPRTSPPREVCLTREVTQFQFSRDGQTYPLILPGFRTSYEDEYRQVTLSGIHSSSLIAAPFLVDQPGVGWVAVTEAHLEDYAGMYLKHLDGRTMTVALAPRAEEPEVAVSGTTPFASPWRVLMIASEPGRLIESNLVLNLNPPCAIADTSWIKAGKAAWDWWSGDYAEGLYFKLRSGMNTVTMKHYIDFAAASNLQFMLIDAGWSERGRDRSGGDITKTSPHIDMPEILAHAKSKGIGVWLWAHWAAIDRQMDEAFPLFEKWGVVGVKIDYMDRDDQWMVDFYHRVLREAAQHHLMIDFHGAYKPDGIRRTYPNLVTREGVMGLEYLKWSARTTPEHDVMLPFTRMLAGPMDYTPGGFDNVTPAEFEPRYRRPMVLATRAHELALYVVFESPLVMVSDYPGAYKEEPAFQCLRDVPATWDETRALNGHVGEYVTVARRSSRDWYVGSITNRTPREIRLPLGFLGEGEYVAEIYADAPDAATAPKQTSISQQRVRATSELHLKLAPGGGVAIHFRPVESEIPVTSSPPAPPGSTPSS
ncbi:MAG: glycoside hydrolase family 97 protein [Acidobacteriota bacterium]